jgi:hypothetical protein
LGGAGAAFFCAWAGAVLGVEAVRLALFIGSHCLVLLGCGVERAAGLAVEIKKAAR